MQKGTVIDILRDIRDNTAPTELLQENLNLCWTCCELKLISNYVNIIEAKFFSNEEIRYKYKIK